MPRIMMTVQCYIALASINTCPQATTQHHNYKMYVVVAFCLTVNTHYIYIQTFYIITTINKQTYSPENRPTRPRQPTSE